LCERIAEFVESERSRNIKFIVPSLSFRHATLVLPDNFGEFGNVSIDTSGFFYTSSFYSESPQLFVIRDDVIERMVITAPALEHELAKLRDRLDDD
jgi:hypothetical protein